MPQYCHRTSLSFGFIKEAEDCGSVPNGLVCHILLGVLLLNKYLLCNIKKVNSTQPQLSLPVILKTITTFGKFSGFKVQLMPIGLKDLSVIHSSPFHFSMVIYTYIHTYTHTHIYIYIYIYICPKWA